MQDRRAASLDRPEPLGRCHCAPFFEAPRGLPRFPRIQRPRTQRQGSEPKYEVLAAVGFTIQSPETMQLLIALPAHTLSLERRRFVRIALSRVTAPEAGSNLVAGVPDECECNADEYGLQPPDDRGRHQEQTDRLAVLDGE